MEGTTYTIDPQTTVTIREMTHGESVTVAELSIADARRLTGGDFEQLPIKLQSVQAEKRRECCLIGVNGRMVGPGVTVSMLTTGLRARHIDIIDALISRLHDVTQDDLDAVFATAVPHGQGVGTTTANDERIVATAGS